MSMTDAPAYRRCPAVGRDLRHDAARRRPVRGHLAHRRGQAARRRAARLARRALDRGRLPAGQPEGRGVLPPRARPSCSWPPPSWWPSARPAGRRARSTTTRRCAALVEAGDLDGLHRRQELGLPRHRGAADHPRRGRGHGGRVGRVPRRRRPAGVLRRRALLRRLQGQPRVRPAGARGGGHERRRRASCCATPTAARCPTRCSASSARCARYFGRRRRSASTPRTTPAARWPTRSPRCSAGPPRCRARSTATASAPATPTS